MVEISIIFPSYNEGENIEEAVLSAVRFLAKRFKNFEIIIVNDGSSDKTAVALSSLKKKFKFLRVITHAKNEGYGAAVSSGLAAARGELIFFTDSDLQFDFSDLEKLLKKIYQADVVIGYRARRSEGLRRKINATLWRAVAAVLLGVSARDIDCAFKLFRRKAIKDIKVKSKGAAFSAELLYRLRKNDTKIIELPVRHLPRRRGKPTGAKLKVIAKGFKEIWGVYVTDKKLVNSRSWWTYAFAIAALFASRLIFMSRSADFFDSTEYIWRTATPNFLTAISSGHTPYHPLYVAFSNLIYRIFHLSPEISAILPSAILGSLSVVLIFLIVKNLFSPKIAWLASIIYALLPFVFINQITILVDATEHVFYFLSLLLLIYSLKRTKGEYLLALGAGLSLGLAAFAHTQVAFWILGFLAIFIIVNQDYTRPNLKRLALKLILFLAGSMVFVGAYIWLLIVSEPRNQMGIHTVRDALKFLLFSNSGEKNNLGIFESIRRIISVSTSLLALFAIGGAAAMIKDKKYREVITLLVWFLPASYLSASYIYENLYGRAMIIGLVPLSILAGYFILKFSFWWRSALTVAMIAQLLVLTLPIILSYKLTQAPNENLAKIRSQSQPGGVFISSNISRTWNGYDGQFISFGDVNGGAGTVEQATVEALKKNLPVYLSSDAIRLPYLRYDGHNFDLRSTEIGAADEHPTLLARTFRTMSVVLDRLTDNRLQTVYRIYKDAPPDYLDKISQNLDNGPLVFGQVKSNGQTVSDLAVNLQHSDFCGANSGDITRLDAVFCMFRKIKGTNPVSNWTFSDRDGRFALPEQEDDKIILGSTQTDTTSSDISGEFPQKSNIEIDGDLVGTFSDVKSLQARISSIDSYYVIAAKSEFKLYKFDYKLPKTDILEAENMSGEVGDVGKDAVASGGKVRTNEIEKKSGYLVSGPYVNLPAGKYRVSYVLKTKTSDEQKIDLDVYSGTDNKGYASKSVTDKDLSGGDFKSISLEFDTASEAHDLEFRVRAPGGVITEVDYLKLEKI